MLSRSGAVFISAVCVLIEFLAAAAWPQQMSNIERGRAHVMLQVAANEVRKHYYDPKFHGLDWNAKIAEAKKKINDAKSFNMAMSNIAAMLDSLHDSHTFLLPPEHAYHFDFGWQYQIIGERCFVTEVRSKSDAETKGLKTGDEVLTINGYTPSRDDLWKMQYVFSILRPQPELQLLLQDPAGKQRQVAVASKIREFKHVTDLTGEDGASDIWDLIRQDETQEHLMRVRYAEFGDALLILKMPQFSASPIEVAGMIDKARKHKALILDLRGNEGGNVDTLNHLIAGMFDKDVKIGDLVGRKESKPQITKGSRNPFTGKLVVLVDSQSASAAEIFARVMQIEKRGLVVGDHTSGSVMEARHYDEKMGADTLIFYGISVTEADLIMTDGKSLEHTGVTPDQILLPSPSALAAGRDPVLARTAEALGVNLTSDAAGKLFPYEWTE